MLNRPNNTYGHTRNDERMEIEKIKMKAKQDGHVPDGSSLYPDGPIAKIILWILGIGFVGFLVFAIFFW